MKVFFLQIFHRIVALLLLLLVMSLHCWKIQPLSHYEEVIQKNNLKPSSEHSNELESNSNAGEKAISTPWPLTLPTQRTIPPINKIPTPKPPYQGSISARAGAAIGGGILSGFVLCCKIFSSCCKKSENV